MSIFDTLYGFNPNVIQPTYQQPRYTTTAVPSTINPIGTTTDLTPVNGDDGAKQFSMRPNSRVALFDTNDDIMYIKQTDANCYPTLKKYRFTEIVDTPATIENEQKYVTIEEFNKFKEELLNGQQSIRASEFATGTSKSASKPKSFKPKSDDADV